MLAFLAAAVALPSDDPVQLVPQLVAAFAAHDWRTVGALGIVLFVMLVRWAARLKTEGLPPWLAKALGWLRTDRGGAALSLTLGLLAAVGSLLASGGTITLATILSGLVNAAIASGGFVLVKKLFWPADKAPAKLDPDTLVKTPVADKPVDRIGG